MTRLPIYLYAVFMISWFLHLPARYTVLGAVRFDLVLVCILAAMTISQAKEIPSPRDRCIRRSLWALVLFAALSMPLVEWPGSVLKTGFQQFFKAFVFYWFTVQFVTSPRRLKFILGVFVACQMFRVLEPLYLHYTEGYWGSAASMADWESMDRLSGAPNDVVNPNGLAFVVLTVIPFLHYGTAGSVPARLVYLVALPLIVQTLVLTGSRSGMLGLVAIVAVIWLKSKRTVVVSLVLVAGVAFTLPRLSGDMADRYLSIVDRQTKNAGTADDRFKIVYEDLLLAKRRPLFGHGLGTSREVNANFGVHDQPSHNLYVEIIQEIGVIGLLLFIWFMGSLVTVLFRAASMLRTPESYPPELRNLASALQVWVGMNVLFSMASYGLCGYEWYLAAGLTSVFMRLATPVVERAAALSPARVITQPALTFVPAMATIDRFQGMRPRF